MLFLYVHILSISYKQVKIDVEKLFEISYILSCVAEVHHFCLC
jgi:hypothetical protein